MKIFDEYTNILKVCIVYYLTEDPTTGGVPRLLLSTLSQSDSLTKLGNGKRERKMERNNSSFFYV